MVSTPFESWRDTLDVASALWKHTNICCVAYCQDGALKTTCACDFGNNAMVHSLDGDHYGELRDDLNGMEDLQKEIIRVIHPGSFIDDPTRMYRAVRYENRYGFKLAEETVALIPEARPFVEKLSPQRIRHELDLILDEANAISMLARLDELDSSIHPALQASNNQSHNRKSDDPAPKSEILGCYGSCTSLTKQFR
jgi:hypothetical protein